jgi:hypothetical protein
LKYAKRHGLRQPSGALPENKRFAEFPHELLNTNDNINRHGIGQCHMPGDTDGFADLSAQPQEHFGDCAAAGPGCRAMAASMMSAICSAAFGACHCASAA